MVGAERISKSEQCTVDREKRTLLCGRKKEFSKRKRHEGKVDLRMIRLLLQEQLCTYCTWYILLKDKNQLFPFNVWL